MLAMEGANPFIMLKMEILFLKEYNALGGRSAGGLMKKNTLIFMAFLVFFVCLGPERVGSAKQVRLISPRYDVYIGFLATGDCPPPHWGNAYFKKFSFDSVIRDVCFEFGDQTVGKRSYNWWFASLGFSSEIATPALIGSLGEGKIDDTDLCPFWNLNSYHGKEKCTLVNVTRKFQPTMKPLDVGHIGRLKNLLDPEPLKPESEYNLPHVPITPLVQPCVFEYSTNFYKQTEVSLEYSDARPEIGNILFYSILPRVDLKAGKEVKYEFPFKIPEVKGSGIMTIRYVPVQKK